MFTLSSLPAVYLVRLYKEQDAQDLLTAIPAGSRVVTIDTPPTPGLAAFLQGLRARGDEAVVRDHHSLAAAPRNPREQETAQASQLIASLAAEGSVLSNRDADPACSSLLTEGEFAGWIVVADADCDGLTAALKAVGRPYSGLDADAAVLDGAPAGKTADRLTRLGFALARCWAARPPFDAPKGERLEKATAALFERFVQAAGGDTSALEALETQAQEFEAMTATASELAAKAVELAPGLFLADAVGAPKFDFGEFARSMSVRGAIVTVTRKGDGPIAAKHNGIQFSAAVADSYKEKVNLTELKPEGVDNTPEAGVLSNTSFLFHCNQQWWEKVKDGMAALVAAARS